MKKSISSFLASFFIKFFKTKKARFLFLLKSFFNLFKIIFLILKLLKKIFGLLFNNNSKISLLSKIFLFAWFIVFVTKLETVSLFLKTSFDSFFDKLAASKILIEG